LLQPVDIAYGENQKLHGQAFVHNISVGAVKIERNHVLSPSSMLASSQQQS
jgi:hypothetical protein